MYNKQRWNCLLNWVALMLVPSITYHLDLSFSSVFVYGASSSTPSLSLCLRVCKRDTYRRRAQRAHIMLFPSRQTAGIVRQNRDSAIGPDQTDIMGICTSLPTAFCLLRIKQVRWPRSCSASVRPAIRRASTGHGFDLHAAVEPVSRFSLSSLPSQKVNR